ncbi:Glucosyltransferase-like protein [Blastocladiella emersonii ATCC 22665]|nr:Glucosyltransferase-like protein [Blastocladiella emersonii ATCC 22665]
MQSNGASLRKRPAAGAPSGVRPLNLAALASDSDSRPAASPLSARDRKSPLSPHHDEDDPDECLMSHLLVGATSGRRALFWAIVFSALLVRAAVARHSWSGRATPPMFGDFEAQRHWLEITLHLPPAAWYRYDLGYWGLDYPPLTAYVSWVFGVVAHAINPAWVALDASRGNESRGLVTFMRATVLFSDVLVYFPAAVHFINTVLRRSGEKAKLLGLAVLLGFPGLILIDHGHFQYNLIMLGLAMFAVSWMVSGAYLRAAVAFSLALLFKQMALYFALPVFVFLLSKCFDAKHGIRLFVALGVTVIATFAVNLFPFRYDLGQVAHRVFPVARGLYEDKVANVWCAISPVLKLRTLFTLDQLVQLSLASTLFASLPSLIGLFRHPTPARLLASLTAVSLAFFLFAFQVHEKSILLPLTPALLLLASDFARHAHWVVPLANLASFSMYPLLRRDGLLVPYAVLTAGWHALFAVTPTSVPRWCGGWAYRVAVLAVTMACLAIHLAEALVPPPPRFPDTYVLLNQMVSCAGFVAAWVYATGLSLGMVE